MLIISTFIYTKGRSPLTVIPKDIKLVLFARVIMGQVGFSIQNAAVVLLPLSMFTIIQKTSPFCIAILGYLILNEAILKIEIGGMAICFGAFIFITLSDNDTSDSIEETTSSVSTAGRLLGIVLTISTAWI